MNSKFTKKTLKTNVLKSGPMIELVKTLKFNDLIMVEPMMIKFIIFNINNVNKYK